MSAWSRQWILCGLSSGLVVAAALSVRPVRAEEFTLQDAEAQVQTVVPAPQGSSGAQGTEETRGTIGLDAQGRAVLATEGSHVIGYRLAPDGKILEHVDESGNRAFYQYDAAGRLIEERIQPAGHAAWVGHFVADQNRNVFAQATEQVGANHLSASLQALGAEPWFDEYELPELPGEPSTRVVDSSFAQRILQRPAEGSGGAGVALQTTTGPGWTSGGAQLSMTVTQSEVPEGYLLQDDWGGWQLLTYDAIGHVATVSDDNGSVARFARDATFKLTDVALADDWILHYVYDEYGEWTKKQVLEKATGAVVFEAVRAPGMDTPGSIHKGSVLPRLSSHIALGDSGPIVEWGDQVCQNGCLVATFKTEPYALIELLNPGDSGNVRSGEGSTRSVLYSLPLSEGERLDYSATKLLLHLEVERAGDIAYEPTTVLVELDRAAALSDLAASLSLKQSHPRRGRRGNKDCRPTGGKVYVCRTIGGAYSCYWDITTCSPPPAPYIPPLFPLPMTPVNPRPSIPQQRNRDRGDALSQTQQRTVDNAVRQARAKLTLQTCAMLFGKPAYSSHDPFYIIDTSNYWNGTAVMASGSRPCGTSGRPAWTFPLSRNVEVCFPAFDNRTDNERVVAIIHEGLHSAGQAEVENATDPRHRQDPIRFPTPDEISNWVRDACDLH